jgi:phenylacetic acid degradation operon negative regulatory protein
VISRRRSVERPSVHTQFLAFTLFGEYLLERGASIWTSDLLALMALLGVSERAMRSVLSRMTRRGWITARKQGRRSQYSLTGRGRELLERGKKRIFEPVITDWDGLWHMVVYSLPERQRRKRHALRTQLYWLGFGLLTHGTWISPHNRFAELESIFQELDIEPYVQQFSGTFGGRASNQTLVFRCWDFEGLETQYRVFMDRFLPAYNECRNIIEKGQSLNPEDCFVRLFWLTHEFQSFPLKDPNLPTVLLPADWIGLAARKLFEDYHRILAVHANQFVADAIQGRMTVPTGTAS